MDVKIKVIKLRFGTHKVSVESDSSSKAKKATSSSSILIVPKSPSNMVSATFLSSTRDYAQLNGESGPVILQIHLAEQEFQVFSMTENAAPALILKIEPLTLKNSSGNVVMPMQSPTAQLAASKAEVSASLDRVLTHHSGIGDATTKADSDLDLLPARTALEGFSILLSDSTAANVELEYKALAYNGSETSWLRNGQFCGSRGHGMPLLGVAIRLKSKNATSYDCEYQVSFFSGAKSSMGRNGMPVKSMQASDPIVNISVRIAAKSNAQAPIKPVASAQPSKVVLKPENPKAVIKKAIIEKEDKKTTKPLKVAKPEKAVQKPRKK